MNGNKYIAFLVAWFASLGVAFYSGSLNPRFVSDAPESLPPEDSQHSYQTEIILVGFTNKVPRSFSDGFSPERQRGLEALAKTSDTFVFDYRLSELIKGLRPEDFPRFLAEVNMVFDRDSRKNAVYMATLETWAEQDLFQALEVTDQLREDNRALWKDCMAAVAPTWAEKNPLHAMEWFFSNVRSTEVPTELVANALFDKNPELFANAILANKDLLNPSVQTALLNMAVRKSHDSIERIASVIALYDNLDILNHFQESYLAEKIALNLCLIDDSAAIEWVDTLADGDVQVYALNGILARMKSDELLAVYDRTQHWELSDVARTKATTDILRTLAYKDYASTKSLYLDIKGQSEIRINITGLIWNINYNRIPAEQLPQEIAFWLSEAPDIKARAAMARSILMKFDENRPDFQQLKSQITPHILEEYDADHQLIALPPW